MNIKTIIIEGVNQDITMARTNHGAEVTIEQHTSNEGKHVVCIAHIARDEDRMSRYAKAVEVAKLVYGTNRRGDVAATNSMVHEVLGEMERIAGC